MKNIVFFLGSFLIAVLKLSAHAEPRFSHLTTRDGLSQSTVFAIIQDQTGFLWFATNDGLNRYDGLQFKQFRHEQANPASLPDSWTTALCVDQSGRLWVGTYGYGLARFAPNGRDVIRVDLRLGHIERGLSQHLVKDLCEVSPGQLWVGLESHGIVVVDANDQPLAHYQQSVGLPSDNVRDILKGHDGTVWVATDGGLAQFNKVVHRFTSVQMTTSDGVQPRDITQIVEDDQKRIWIGTREDGLFRYDPATQILDHYQDGQSGFIGQQVLALLVDANGSVWVGTGQSGLLHYQPAQNRFIAYEPNPELADALHDATIYSLFQDRSSVVWIGTYSKGLSKCNLDLQIFRLFQPSPGTPNSLKGRMINCFVEEKQNLWIGTYESGLNLFDRFTKTYRHYQHNPDDPTSLSSDLVRHLLRDQTGQIWVATEAGLNRLRPDRNGFDRIPINLPSGQPAPTLFVYEDSASRFWVATYGKGLVQLDRKTGAQVAFTSSSQNYSISNHYVNCVLEDSRKRLWVGTEDGLNTFDPQRKTFTRYMASQDPHTLNHGSVMSLMQRQGEHNQLWIGTYGGGVNILNLDTGQFKHITTQNGLPNDAIYGIVEDPLGFLWFSTNNGLCRFDPKMETAQNFNTGDGLVNNEFNRNAYLRSSEGQLYFGGEGFVSVDPRHIATNKQIPKVALTRVLIANKEQLFDKPLSELTELNLAPDDQVVNLSVAALDFNSPERNRFAYRLSGFLDSWTYLDENTITFTHLDAGTYQLQVKGSNNDGVWNEEGLSLTLNVAPYWWESLAFKLAGIVLMIGLAVRYWAYRKRETTKELERAINQGKAEFATSVLHNIGNVLNSLKVACDRTEFLLKESKLKQLLRAQELLSQNLANVDYYLKEDPRGRLLPGYFKSAGEVLQDEHQEMLRECREMGEKISLMNDIIETQQAHAATSTADETHNLNQVVMDALKVQENSLAQRQIRIEEKLSPLPPIRVSRTQVMHMVINLVKNAREAMEANGDRERKLILETGRLPENKVFLRIQDTGMGIAPEHLSKLATFGFTTKTEGHGFGLHYCSRAMRSMGGSLICESEGWNKGASFTLLFPIPPGQTE